MTKCIYMRNTGELIVWWDDMLTPIYISALDRGADISILEVPESIENEIRVGKLEYRFINGKLERYDNI